MTSPERETCDEWISTLQTTLCILYTKSPLFSQERATPTLSLTPPPYLYPDSSPLPLTLTRTPPLTRTFCACT